MSGYMSDFDSLFLDAAPTMKEDSMIELMHMSKEFDLIDLARRTEDALKPMITRKRFQNDVSASIPDWWSSTTCNSATVIFNIILKAK